MIKAGERIRIEVLELTDQQQKEIKTLNHVYQVDYGNGELCVQCSGGHHNLVHILEYLQSHDISFGRVFAELPTLNDVFLEITGKELRD